MPRQTLGRTLATLTSGCFARQAVWVHGKLPCVKEHGRALGEEVNDALLLEDTPETDKGIDFMVCLYTGDPKK
jgi:hypothetical protein